MRAKDKRAAILAAPPLSENIISRLREQIRRTLKIRLTENGWKPIDGCTVAELQSFDHLDPPADAIFTVKSVASEERCPVAIHYIEGSGVLHYTCTLRRTSGRFVQENGHIDAVTEAFTVGSAPNWDSSPESAPPPAPEPAAVQQPVVTRRPEKAPAPAAAPVPASPVVVVRKPRTAERAVVPTAPVRRPAPESPPPRPIAVPRDVEPEQATRDFLAEIIQGTSERGTHVLRWADLRRSLFPGSQGWPALRAWCAANALTCEISLGQSSKRAEVLFRNIGAAVSGPSGGAGSLSCRAGS